MKKIAIVLLFAEFSFVLFAQEQTITDKFPSTRFLDIEYEMLSPTDYSSKIYGEDYEKGRIKNTTRFKLSMNYPIYKIRRLTITPLIRYKFESFEFENIENKSINYPTIHHGERINTHYISTSVNTTYISKLFNKNIVYRLNLSFDASEKGYEHMAATLVGIMILKKDAQTNMSFGLVASFDKASLVPVFPLFSYEYKFTHSQWVFDLFFPKHLYFRRLLFANGRLSLGTFLEEDGFFGHPEYQELDDSYNVVKRELKTGFVYEHYVNRHFVLSFKGGIINTMEWEVAKKNSRKAIIKYSPDMNMYFNIGFSYNL